MRTVTDRQGHRAWRTDGQWRIDG